jgi:predicted MFS family arabinose efflux permease
LADHDAAPNARWLIVAVLAAGSFTTALNVTMLSPLLSAIGADFDVSAAATGQVATMTAATSGVTALVAAPWMDRWSRRSWLRFEVVLLVLGTLLSALAPSFGWLLAARVLAGVGGAIIYAHCVAAAAELFADPAQRNRVIGLLATSITLGSILGLPALAQVAGAVGWRWAVASLLPLAALVLVGTAWLPGTARTARGPLWQGWWTRYRDVLARRESLWLLGAVMLLMSAWFGWLIYFGAFAVQAYGAGANVLSALYLAGGVAQVVGSNLAPVLLRRFSPRIVASVAAVVIAVDLLGVGILFDGAWSLAPFLVIASLGAAMLFLCISILLLDSFPTARGAVMSLQSAGLNLGGAVGVALFGTTLALLDDYAATYRLLSISMVLVVVVLMLSARSAAAAGRRTDAATTSKPEPLAP